MGPKSARSLDEWYKLINQIYIDRNFERHPATVYSHLVEVVSGLSLLATDKKKRGVTPENFIPKAFAWWLALCGKLGIRSVEDMIWAKFPAICPYCKKGNPHHPDCQIIKAADPYPHWTELKDIADKTYSKKPKTFKDWQLMFFEIYGSSQGESYDKVFSRLNEELGELAEAVRAFELAPGLFFSEAPDVFAWLMKVQNVLDSKNHVPIDKRGIFISEYFERQYPDRCLECKKMICRCPSILPSSLRRIAKEAPEATGIFNGRGPLLRQDEIQKLFELGETELHYGGQSVPVD